MSSSNNKPRINLRYFNPETNGINDFVHDYKARLKDFFAAFDADLEERLKDPTFRRAHEQALAKIPNPTEKDREKDKLELEYWSWISSCSRKDNLLNLKKDGGKRIR